MDLLRDHILNSSATPYLTDAEIEETCKDLEPLLQSEKAAEGLAHAYALIRAAPQDSRPQLLAANLLEKTRRKTDMLDTWTGVHDRFPHLQHPLRFLVRWQNRAGLCQDAADLLSVMIETNDGSIRAIELATLCAEIKDDDLAKGLFDNLLEKYPGDVRLHVIYGKSLFARGDVYGAFSVLDPISDANLSKTARKVVESSEKAHDAMTALSQGEASVLSKAIEYFSTREPREVPKDRIEGIVFYTGSLGAGGAERQLTQMASAFHHRNRARRNVHGTRIAGKVEVIVNNVDKDRGKNFFVPALKASGVPLHVTTDFPVQDLSEVAPELENISELLSLLPRNVRFGLEHLTQYFKTTSPDVAYFWQDGAVLTGALAALIAGIPRIAISLRGLPPNLRPKMMKPEYPDLYQALAKIPGVTFSCNSRCAADAYAQWLNLPPSRFNVIYNAVPKLPEEAEANDHKRWDLFERETPDATFTVGGVFRFNPNKRGHLWLKYARDVLDAHPQTRFLLVGDGEELASAQSYAADLGLEDRILFVGNSKHPGFWLSKMDCSCLLSENEGLPNVLIEAQMAGIPVVSTPAGGASETFEDGHTGFLLSSSKDPSKQEFALYLHNLISDPALCQKMGERGKLMASERFERETVFAQTIRLFHGETVAGDREIVGDKKVTALKVKPRVTPFDARVTAAYTVVAKL